MKKMRKNFAKLFMGIMAVLMVITAGPVSAQAGNVCNFITGSARSVRTFTVQTKNTWLCSDKITLKQSGKGTAKGMKWLGGGSKTYKIYGYYNIQMSYTKNNKTYTEKKTWSGKSITLYLKKGVKYTITVRPMENSTISARQALRGGFYGWVTAPTWSVTKTKNIIMCG